MKPTPDQLEHFKVGLVICEVPRHLWDGLTAWVVDGRPTGSFLYAVLTNDLKDACKRADFENQRHLWDIVNFLYNYAPLECWGDVERVDEWQQKHEEQRKGASV